MFVLAHEPRAWWPVALAQPADGGRIEEAAFELRFRRLSVPDFEALLAAQTTADPALAAPARDLAFLVRVADDWRGVAAADGTPAPFAEPWLSRAVETPGFAEAVGRAYGRFWQAQGQAAEKNSAASRGGGPAAAAATAAPPSSPKPRGASSTRRPRRS